LCDALAIGAPLRNLRLQLPGRQAGQEAIRPNAPGDV